MATKRNVTVVISSAGGRDTHKLTDYIAFMQAKMAEIPKAYRDSAVIDIDTEEIDYSDGAYRPMVQIMYKRPETAGEALKREEKARKENELAEERERALFEVLSKKFGPKGQA